MVVVDLGTGSGQAVLRLARENPTALVIGIDADARAMADSSRRAAAPAKRGGVPNALFFAAAAEALPGVLAGTVDRLTIALPWGSLLRGVLAPDETLLRAVAETLKPDGQLEVLISATERDSAAGTTLITPADAEDLARRLTAAGMAVVQFRPADSSDVDRLSSAWARRLGIPGRRPAWIYELRPVPVVNQADGRACRHRAAVPASRAPATAG